MRLAKVNTKRAVEKRKGKTVEPSRKELRKKKKLQKKQRMQNYQVIKQERSMNKAVRRVNMKKDSQPPHASGLGSQNKKREMCREKEMIGLNEEQEQSQENFSGEMDDVMEEFDKIGQQGQQYGGQFEGEEDQIDSEEDFHEEDQMNLHSDDQIIEKLEQKLKIKGSKSKKYDKMALSMGFDNDLFDFLDGISSKVKTGKKQNKIRQIKANKQPKSILKNKGGQEKNKQQTHHTPAAPQDEVNAVRKGPPKLADGENGEVRKLMNALFNKISDGNLLYTVRSFIDIFENNPKALTIQTFSNLFVRFNLLIEKPLMHVLSANVVAAVALHRMYGDRLMAELVYEATKCYEELGGQVEEEGEVMEIGYSRVFEKKKNYFTILCFLYEFSSICGDFLGSIVGRLAGGLESKDNMEFIYLIIQKCGARMRAHDTGTLKEVMEVLKEGIERARHNGTYETTKIKFIDIEINEIRFNRKNLFDADQRMGFLHTFLTRTLTAEFPLQKRTLDLTYQLVAKAHPAHHEWWLSGQPHQQQPEQDSQPQAVRVETEEMRQLRELAKAYHFVTEIRKHIFYQLMSSSDYIEATKKILELKVKRLEEVATVLLEANGNEPKVFNPFYSLVAAKIAEEIPKFRVCLQFALWDRFKQLEFLDARKLSNLAKLAAWLISNEGSNTSLSIFKFFPDLSNLQPREMVLMKVFFREFLKKVKRNYLIKITDKLKDKKNKHVRDGLKQLLGDLKQAFKCESERVQENCKILKKMMMIQEVNEMENDDR